MFIMKITWLGHSSFLLQDSHGRKALMDPFDESVGYETFKGEADVVTISHHHFDHDYTEAVQGRPEIVDKTGFFQACDINITGIPSWHDKEKGAKRGEITICVVEMDGFRICHLGDVGYVLSDEEIKTLGKVDVLMIPVGGNFTIDGKEAAVLAKKINASMVIPMHYGTPALSFPLDGVEAFASNMKNAERVGSNTIEISHPLTGSNLVKILDYK